MYTILIIEDDAVIRTEVKTLLGKYGYNAVTIEDFSVAVEHTLQLNPHLILLDLNLPVYDGYHICRELRKSSKIPIIVVTSRNSDLDELMSINLGADDFITKPYNTQILLARISAVLGRTYSGIQSNDLTYHTLTLNTDKSTVTNIDKTCELTKNELRILSLLIKSVGKIVSRDDIMNELWQSDEFVDDNTLTVNINRLRNKLSQIGATDVIKTKRGQGYILWD